MEENVAAVILGLGPKQSQKSDAEFLYDPRLWKRQRKTQAHIFLSLLLSSVIWLSRENLHKAMPKCFLDAFGMKATVIIDCYEIFIDRPTNLLARAPTFSSYKHHNTVKNLIGLTPQGTISFVSEAWGGRV